MDQVLKHTLLLILLTFTLVANGQTTISHETPEKIFNNFCDCFENDNRELGTSFYSMEITFDIDSVAYVEIFWNASFTEQYRLPIDQALLQVNNFEVEMSAIDAAIYNDTILKVRYVIPELEFSDRIQPYGFLIGPFHYRYNRLIVNSQKLRCGELFIQIAE